MINMTDNTIEIKKDVKLNNVMQLIDLNDNQKTFRAEFIVQSDLKPFKACIVNQDQLDNGQIIFEDCMDGKFARRIVYQDSTPLNHYIALKADQEIDCKVQIHISPIPPISSNNIPQIPPQMDVQTREELGKELEQLSNDKEYQQLDDIKLDNDDLVIDQQDIDMINGQREKHFNANHWIIVGIICLLLCILLFLRSRQLFPFHSTDN